MMATKSFGEWLQEKRERAGLSKVRLAKLAEVDRAHIRKMEKGDIRLPETGTRARLHAVLGTSDQELIDAGIMTRREFPRPDGSVEEVFEAAPRPSRSPAHAACEESPPYDMAGSIPTRLLDLLPDVQWTETRAQTVAEILESMIVIDRDRARDLMGDDAPGAPGPSPAESLGSERR